MIRLLRHHPRIVAFLAAWLAGVYLAASVGVIPSPRAVMTWVSRAARAVGAEWVVGAGQRYPCEDCGCGCASAAECWTRCCCHTERQRLAWAIEHGVQPPESVLTFFEDELWVAAANDVAPGTAECVLCVPGIKERVRRGIPTARVKAAEGIVWTHADACGGSGAGAVESSSTLSCCGSRSPASCDGTCGDACGGSCADADAGPAWPGPTISAMTCKGQSSLFAFSLPPVPPLRAADVLAPEPILVEPGWPTEFTSTTRHLDVAAPPPRPVHA